jgi:hypothetical protein
VNLKQEAQSTEEFILNLPNDEYLTYIDINVEQKTNFFMMQSEILVSSVNQIL